MRLFPKYEYGDESRNLKTRASEVGIFRHTSPVKASPASQSRSQTNSL